MILMILSRKKFLLNLKNLIDFEEERRAKPNMDETQTINIGTEEDPKLVLIGSTLTLEEKSELTSLLKEYKDVFAWSYQDMPGIDPEIVQHHIALHPDSKPVKQKLRKIRPDWMLKLKEEITR